MMTDSQRLRNLIRTGRRSLAVTCALVLALTLSACGGARPQEQQEMIDAYRAGRYQESLAKAEHVAAHSSGIERDRAALIAGQSAHATGARTIAEKWLMPLTSHADTEINGNANATLGLMNFNLRNYGSAAVMLSAAASRLTGDDAARSAMYAGDCYEQLGQTIKARNSMQQAMTLAQDPGLKRSIQDRLVQGPYVVQLGALSKRDAADKLARQHAPAAIRAGLPAPKVVASAAQAGATLWAVQVGPFPSRPAAEAAKARAGLPGVVMVPGR